MAFFKFSWFGKKEAADKSVTRSRAAQVESVDVMRSRARHRLIGAAVLVLVGVVGFPLLFDTQPRPIPVDIPIEIPDRGHVAPLMVPGETAAPAAAARPSTSVSTHASLDKGEEVFEPSTPVAPPRAAAVPVPMPPVPPLMSPPAAAPVKAETPKPAPAKPEQKVEAPVKPKPEPKPEPKPKPETKPEPKPESKPEPKVEQKPKVDEAARARALLEGRAPAAAEASSSSERVVVQVGAFGDADKAREVRAKLEGAGLKAFTQTVSTKDGQRTRVRVGPFNSRAEADKAAARVKGLGLPASVIKP